MQKFDNKKGKRRRLDLANMKEEDAEKFYAQCLGLSKELQKQCEKELKQQIQKKEDDDILQWILAIYSKSGKLIGKMEISSMDGKEASLRIQIPNENWILKYGVEALDQFLKICSENHYFTRIELVSSAITERYRKMHNLSSRIIEIA